MNAIAKPFIKWAGGKTQLLKKFQDLYPIQLKQHKIKKFYEPFLGSGAVFFDIAQKYTIESAFLYDINDDLILTYRVIQKDVEKLLELLNRYQKVYSKLNEKQRKDFFYQQRAEFNQQRNSIDYHNITDMHFKRAAVLIFLNRTCFNGLYRVNSGGEFNTPAGNYKNPSICDEKNLMAVHELLQCAEICKAGFYEIHNSIMQNSFVYFDPPYRPISKTASFKSYSKHDFSDKEQTQLANLFRTLDRKGALVMLSNSDPKNHNPSDSFFDDLYSNFNIVRIPAKRIINSNASKRGEINEIVVTNYKIG